MVFEFYIAIHGIIEILDSYSEKKQMNESVIYVQEGFDQDNKPVETQENRGIHYDSIILSNMPSSKGSDTAGGVRLQKRKKSTKKGKKKKKKSKSKSKKSISKM
jgi:hypothetical protein